MHSDYSADSVKPQAPAKRRRSRWRYFFYLVLFCALFVLSLTIQSSIVSDDSASVWSQLVDASERYIKPKFGFGDTLSAFTSDAQDVLSGMDEDRVNVLLMGIGGKGHDGANLTDTIMIASYKPSTNQAALLSIPRDLLIPIPGYGWRKINNLYALAEANDRGTGGDYAKQIISQIFGLKIPYYMRIDFSGFEELVDLVGGVDVEVPRTLSDYKYPIPGREDYPEDQRYEHLYVEAGPQHFDGSTALKYVRSRHALGEEGSDFARASRQQIVINALTDKLVSFNTLLRPSRIKKIIENVDENIDTNLSLDEMVAFAKLARDYKEQENPPHIIHTVLDNSADGPLRAANYGGAFVLEPRVEDFSELKFMAANLFSPEKTFELPSNPSGLPRVTLPNPVETEETATIEIRNGTFVNGLARANQEKLAELGYDVIAISNAKEQDYEQTVVYDFSNGKYPRTIDFLAGNYTDNITAQIPLGLTTEADILIILGLDTAY